MLRTTRDFEQLADAYLARAAAQGVRHAEIFFDPQAHLERCAGCGAQAPCLRRCHPLLAWQRRGMQVSFGLSALGLSGK